MTTTRVFSLLIVDDDPLIHQSLNLCLPNNWKIFSAQKLEAIQYERFYHAAFVDMHLEPGKGPVGPAIIEKLIKANNQLDIVAMSGDLNRELMETCLKAGAQRFLAKPLSPEEVQLVAEKIEALWSLRNVDPNSNRHSVRWVGFSPASQQIRKRIAELRGETSPVLIEGETGCGKEVTARLLHEQESERPFIAVNLASIPDNLFESEMFGHVKGAFTGADQNKMGLTEAANGGDLFLDEVEALPLTQQAKLLRFLESGEVRRVGAKESTHVKVRVIAASNKPLDKMVANGEFREDLLYRLASQRIALTLFLAGGMRYLLPDGSDKYWLASGLVASLGGFIGDLVMTAVRRDAGMKTVGPFILGRGDLLHRVDRLIFVAPIYYYVMTAIL